MNIESVNFPKREDIFKNDLQLPHVTRFDDLINGSLTYNDIFEYNRTGFTGMSIHNLYVLVECIERIQEIMKHHDGLIDQVVGSERFKLLNSIDEMVKSDSPMDVYEKYSPLYLKLSNPRTEEKTNTNFKKRNFFVDFSNNRFCPPYPECFNEEELGDQDTSNCSDLLSFSIEEQ